jgi:hypothetical protein
MLPALGMVGNQVGALELDRVPGDGRPGGGVGAERGERLVEGVRDDEVGVDAVEVVAAWRYS